MGESRGCVRAFICMSVVVLVAECAMCGLTLEARSSISGARVPWVTCGAAPMVIHKTSGANLWESSCDLILVCDARFDFILTSVRACVRECVCGCRVAARVSVRLAKSVRRVCCGEEVGGGEPAMAPV